jgi:hypothetical protein
VRAALLALVVVLAAQDCSPPDQPPPSPTQTRKCQEDDPCWNCHTMGDRKCGPGAGAALSAGEVGHPWERPV